MPIYQYRCPKCGLEIEKLSQSFGGEDPPECPQDVDCPEDLGDGPTFERVIGKPAAHFKGDGFHTTDYDDAENPASNNQ